MIGKRSGLILTMICIPLFIVIIVKIIQFFDNLKIQKIKKNQSTINCKIIDAGSMKGSYIIAEYRYRDVVYRHRRSSHSNDIKIGENFKLILDSLKPSRSEIMLESPFFMNHKIRIQRQG